MICVGEPAPPICLCRNLFLLETSLSQDLLDAPHHCGFGRHVDMAAASGEVDVEEGFVEEQRVTRRGTAQPVNPTNLGLNPLTRIRPLLVGRSVDLEQRRCCRPRREYFNHCQRPRHTRLVADEKMPIGTLLQSDLAAWPDGVDSVTRSRGANPIGSRSGAMKRDIDDHRCSCRIKATDRVAPVRHCPTRSRHPEHQILTRRVAQTIEARSRQEQSPHGR